MTVAGAELIVLGLGSVLALDDGAGVAALSELERAFVLPPELAVLDGGVLGLHLLGLVEDARDLLVLDAVNFGGRPGELVRLEGDQLRTAFSARLSLHELGFGEVLATAHLRGSSPRRLVVWGIQPERVGPGLGLSPAIAGALGALAAAAAAELVSWGVPVAARRCPEPAPPYPDGVLARALTASRGPGA